MSDKKPPVLELVNDSKKPRKKEINKADNDVNLSFGDYTVQDRQFVHVKQTKDGPVDYKLCNFVCKILEEITHDDGLEDRAFLRISGNRQDGFPLPEVEVQAAKFYSTTGSWFNDAWGLKVFVHPGSQKKDNLRAAIQLYSTLNGDIPSRHVYGYTGWKKINDQWLYLTGTGGIGVDGLKDHVQVDLGAGHMSSYQLPEPDQEQVAAFSQVITDLLNICPGKPHIGAALLAAVARAPLGECHPTDFAIYIHGLTGAKKSAIAAIALAFFGDFTARSFPANWSDTENDIEAKGFAVKDAVFVVDDFKPSVNATEAAKLHGKAERFIRNTGNQAGRGRRGADMQARPAPYNRSMTLITGEDLPKGQSLLGRLLILELCREDVDVAALTRLQKAAEAGQLSALMSCYLQYLASRMDDFKKNFSQAVTVLRNSTIQQGFASSHPRAPEIYANLVAGAESFLDFLTDTGSFSQEQSNVMLGDIEDSLQNAFTEQTAYQSDQDEVERFFDLLRALFSSGNAHIASRLDQGPPPSRPHAWGWRADGTDAAGDKIYKPMGGLIGWYYDKDNRQVWLERQYAFAAVQQMARAQGDAFLLSPASLWRRLDDRRLIVQTELNQNGSKQLAVKKMVGGKRTRVLILSADLVESGE